MTPSLEDLTSRACGLLGISRSEGSPIFAAVLQATLCEQERCRLVLLRRLAGKLPADELTALEQALEPEWPWGREHPGRLKARGGWQGGERRNTGLAG